MRILKNNTMLLCLGVALCSSLALGGQGKAAASDLEINPYPRHKLAEGTPLSLLHKKPIVGRWETPAGASMKNTLEIWSREAGVSMAWRAAEDFIVRDTVVMEGTYEEAVATLLEQYLFQYERPVGDLHIDTANSRRTLVVTLHSES